jgi:hypothetical protein
MGVQYCKIWHSALGRLAFSHLCRIRHSVVRHSVVWHSVIWHSDIVPHRCCHFDYMYEVVMNFFTTNRPFCHILSRIWSTIYLSKQVKLSGKSKTSWKKLPKSKWNLKHVVRRKANRIRNYFQCLRRLCNLPFVVKSFDARSFNFELTNRWRYGNLGAVITTG